MNNIIREDLKNICNNGLDWEKFKNSSVLITGSNGMIASYMIYTLIYLNEIYPSLNIKIIAQGRNREKMLKKFKDIKESFQFFISIINNEILYHKNIDYIIHTASPASSQFYGTDPVGVILPNVIGTKNLLELAREKKSKGFLFFSSGEVCGVVDKEHIEENDYGYLDPTNIRNCYSESKRIAETMCKCWNHQYNVFTIIVRPDHTYGPTIDLENDSRVFSEFVSNVVNNENIVIKSDGLSVRTFCYISDAVDGFFRALLKGKSGESYNISNNKGKSSIKNLAETLTVLFPEKNLKIIYKKREDTNKYLENENKVQSSLSTKKIELLGYKAKIDIKEGFKRTIESLMEKNDY